MPDINMRYRNGEIDDDLPYVGELKLDEESGLIYDEENDAVDDDTLSQICGNCEKGADDDE
jgi:hypothetical protein